jgi:hypothetical protein
MGRLVSLLNAYYLQWLEYVEKLKMHLKIYTRSFSYMGHLQMQTYAAVFRKGITSTHAPCGTRQY